MNAKLVMFRQDDESREIPLAPGSTTIGRQSECHIRIPLAQVSRRHAEIVVTESTVSLKDLGAANGTLLDDRRISEESPLQPGSRIAIGPVVFFVQINGVPSPVEIERLRVKLSATDEGSGTKLTTSRHVYISDEEIDPIAALEALASSADQTAIGSEEDEIS